MRMRISLDCYPVIGHFIFLGRIWILQDAHLQGITDTMVLEIQKEARLLCSPATIKQWKVLQPSRVLLATLILWVQLLGAWLAALFGPALAWIPAFLVICACITAMQLWVHESSHFTLFDSRRINDLWATVFFSSPIGMSVRAYRQYHMTHHAHLATEKDMDRFAFNVNIRGCRRLLGKLLRGLSCIDGCQIIT